MPEWLTRKFGPLPVWGYALVTAGGYVALRWYKSRQGGAPTGPGDATSAGQIPVGGSPFSFPDNSLPDSGFFPFPPNIPPPVSATSSTNSGGGTAATGTASTATNTTSPSAPSGTGPGGQSRVNLTNPPPNFYNQQPAPAPAPTQTRINLTNPPPNFYTAVPTSAMAQTSGQTRAKL